MNFNPAVYNIKMEVSSSETNMFCFYDDSSVQIMNTSHSKKITGDSYFGVPIHAIVFFKIEM